MRKSYWAAAASVALLSFGLAANAAGPASGTPPAAAPAPTPGAPAAHRYVLTANAELPVANHPFAAIFVDVGAVKMEGALADIDVVYALGAPQQIEGHEVAYIVFHHQADCAKNMVSMPRYSSFDSKGVETSSDSQDQPMHGVTPGSQDAMVLSLACDPATRPAVGYADMHYVLGHAVNYLHVQAEQASAIPHHFVLIGGAANTPYGMMEVFMDTATLERSGDYVMAETVEVYQPPADATKPAFDVDTVVYDCKARTTTPAFSVLYKIDGGPLRTGLTGASPQPVRPGTLNDTMIQVACDSFDPKKGVATTLASAVLGARKALQDAVAKAAPAGPASPAAQAGPPPSTTPAPVQK